MNKVYKTSILFIGNFLSESRGSIGPSEKISKALKEAKLKVTTASSKEFILYRFFDIIFKSCFSDYKFIHIDVYSSKAFYFAQMASSIAKWKNKKVILTLHGGGLPDKFRLSPKSIIKLFKKADQIFTPSNYLQSFFKDQGLEVKYLPNSINLNIFRDRKETRSKFNLLWIRGFQKIYNPHIAIEALSILKDQYPDIKLTMIGPDMGLLEDCKKLIRQLKLVDAISILGPVKNTILPDYLNTHSVLLNTTSFESFGIALIEAAACGIPIVSTAVGEIPLLWDKDKDILLVEEITPEAFAHQITRLLDSPELSKNISKKAREKAEQFDWEIIKQRWLKLFQQNGQHN